MNRKWLVAAGVGIVALAALLHMLFSGEEGSKVEPVSAMAGSGAAGAASPAGAAAVPHFVTGLENLPRSLAGTEVDGELEVDASGHLKITKGVRRLFDYFLSTIGEESLDTILARLRAYIRHQLPDMAAGEALHLLDSYIGYKQALDGVQQAQATAGGSVDTGAVRRQMEQVRALRSQYFTPAVIDAFFGDEDTYDNYTLARLDVLQNASLTPAQRAQQLAALEQQLPQTLQDELHTITQVQNLDTLTADWKKRGGSAAELRQIRENLVGPEAADRLETLDQERSNWDQRMSAWYAERDAILNNQSLSDQDRQSQLAQLRNSRFNATERLRVESLERMHDRGESVDP